MDLAEVLLRGDSTLSRGERELIAAYVSRRQRVRVLRGVARGECGGAATRRRRRRCEQTLAGAVCDAPVSAKMRALLEIAALVRADGRLVSDEAVAAARAQGATDREIHDTVLIAAAFCMFNRYVDGLATAVPDDPVAVRDERRAPDRARLPAAQVGADREDVGAERGSRGRSG